MIACRPYFKRSKRAHAEHMSARAAGAGPWSVADLCAAYRWPTSAPGGTVIGLLEMGGGWVASDITAYCAAHGIPVPTIVDVSVDGTLNRPVAGDDSPDVEVALDIEVLADSYCRATGKAASIRVYWTQDIARALAQAAADGCAVFSMSWGNDEPSWGTAGVQAMQAAAASAVAAGCIPVAAAGDNDADDNDGSGQPSVDCPASCPSVIGCGGTSKTQSSEVVWNNSASNDASGEGTGGGFSAFFPVQSFQIGAPAPAPGLGRMVPDVAANADPNTGYEIYVHGAATVVGGTSAVAPLYAGLLAALGPRDGSVRSVLSALWANKQAFTDIVSGTNGLYPAAVGPDPCTGLGAPVGSQIAAALSSAVTAPTAGGSGLLTSAQVAGVQVAVAAVLAPQDALVEKSRVGPELATAIAALGPVAG